MLDDFVVRAGLAGFGVAAAAGPLGSLVVWRRMAIFGEALANAMLLGIVLATLLELQPTLGVLAFAVMLAVALLALERQRLLPLDTLLSMIAHSALAFGLLALNRLDYVRVDLMSYLFGDVLATSIPDLLTIFALLIVLAIGLALLWQPLLSATVQPDLAAVEGVNLARSRFAFTVMLAALIAIGMKIVGMLLIVSLLVIPAAGARQLTRTPEEMAAVASLLGMLSVLGGLFASLRLDLPAGPAIVACAALLFVAASLSRAAAAWAGLWRWGARPPALPPPAGDGS
jgi:zinc transport system permease protein